MQSTPLIAFDQHAATTVAAVLLCCGTLSNSTCATGSQGSS
jgi:hypothetical protein